MSEMSLLIVAVSSNVMQTHSLHRNYNLTTSIYEQKKYWQSFGELKNSETYQTACRMNLQRNCLLKDDDKGLLDAKAPRRDFLKYLGFSTAAAMVAASCEMPVKKSIPYLNKPDDHCSGCCQILCNYLCAGW